MCRGEVRPLSAEWDANFHWTDVTLWGYQLAELSVGLSFSGLDHLGKATSSGTWQGTGDPRVGSKAPFPEWGAGRSSVDVLLMGLCGLAWPLMFILGSSSQVLDIVSAMNSGRFERGMVVTGQFVFGCSR